MSSRARMRFGIWTVFYWHSFSLAAALSVRAQDAAPQSFDVERYDAGALLAAAESGRPFVLPIFGTDCTVQVAPHTLRAEGFQLTTVKGHRTRTLLPPRTRLFKGSVAGDPESVVRLTIGPNGLHGYVRSAEWTAWIEPMETAAAGAAVADGPADHRVYSGADLDPEFAGECIQELLGSEGGLRGASAHDGASGTTGSPEAFRLAPPEEPLPAGSEGVEFGVLELAAVADFEFFQRYGENALARIETTLNAVEGIYEREIGITLELAHVTIWQESDDPYTSTSALDLLLELRSHWNANRTSVHRDVTHLFTGRDLASSTVGIAYVGVVCDLRNAYSLSQDLISEALNPLLVAHEIGHTLGALHDATGTRPRYIMYPSLGSSNVDEFSLGSKSAISSYLGGAPCVSSESGGSTGGSSGGSSRSRGGGPVDPLLIVLAGAGALAGARRCRR